MKNLSEELQHKLRKHYQKLDSIGLSGEDSSIILFLLTLLKEKINFRISHNISSLDNSPSLFQDLDPKLDLNVEHPKVELNDISENQQYLIEVNEIFNNRLRILSTKSYDKIIQILEEFDEVDLQSHFAEIFDSFLNLIVERQGKKSGEFILPAKIGSFLTQLVELEDDATIFNPFSGLATFGIKLRWNQKFIGQEIDRLVWAISLLRLNAYGRLTNSDVQNADVFDKWPNSKQYDLIITNPPFRLKLNKEQQFKYSNIKGVEHFILEEGVELLKDKGKLITLVPISFLNSEREDKIIRKSLIRKNILESVITFPGGLLSQTNIPFAVLVINKEKKENGKIAFFQAQDFIVKNGKNQVIFESEQLLKLIEETLNTIDSNHLVTEPQAEYGSQKSKKTAILLEDNKVKEYDYNLDIERYRLDRITGTPVGELITLAPLISKGQVNRWFLKKGPMIKTVHMLVHDKDLVKARLVSARDLKNDPLDYKLDLTQLDFDELKNGKIVKGNLVLVSLVGKNLKPTYVECEDDFFYINKNLLPFIINPDLLDLDWFINELHSSHVKNQLDILSSGYTMPFLKKKDFLDIKINVPSIKDQKTEVAKLKGILKQIDNLESNIIQQDSYLRHTLAGPVSDLEEAINNIDKIIQSISKNNLPNIGKLKVSQSHLYTLEDYLSDSKKYISSILETVKSKLNASKDIELKPLKPLNIFDLVSSYCTRKKSISSKYRLEFDFDEGFFGTIDDPKDMAIIEGNEGLLISLLDNVVDNAVKHAFQNDFNNRIELYLTVFMETPGEEVIMLLISNTGTPLPPDFTLEKYIRKGYSQGIHKGEGFGGWLINEIVRKHGGQLDIIDETGREGIVNTDLVTTFEIIFPKIEVDEEI